jgi:hypothetical protein
VKLTQRDQDIVQALASQVRVLSLEQIANHWWPNSKSKEELARKRLAILVDAGFLSSWRLTAAPLPDIVEPVLTWRPGLCEPDLGSAAWTLQSRWKEAARPQRCFLATRNASGLFGGRASGHPKKEFQVSHDLGVAAMYLRIRLTRPQLITKWIGEDVLAPYRKGQKLPDAVIATSPQTPPQLVLEFGGAYDKKRLVSFHQDCQQRLLPYEVW